MKKKRMIPPRLTFTAILLVLLCALLVSLRPAQADPGRQEAAPTAEANQERTPPESTAAQPGGEGPRRTGTLLATALLLGCGMLGMLSAGAGIAVVMGRLRTRRPD